MKYYALFKGFWDAIENNIVSVRSKTIKIDILDPTRNQKIIFFWSNIGKIDATFQNYKIKLTYYSGIRNPD